MTREIFTSVTRVLSILITKQQLPVQVQKEWILKRVYQRFHVLFRLSAMRRGELSTTITQLMSKCLWKGWRWYKGYKEIVSPFTCCPVNREYSWMKSQIEKKKKQIMVYNLYEQTLHVCGCGYCTETSPLSCKTNQ